MFVSNIPMINNASYGMQQDSNSMLGLIRNAGSSQDSKALLNSEKGLMADKIKNETTYKASELMEQSQKKVQDENIKRTFDTFA